MRQKKRKQKEPNKARKQKRTQRAREKPRLKFADLVRINSDETLEQLKVKHLKTKRPDKAPTAVRLGDIRIADKVFQWRRLKYNRIASESHVMGLAKALENGRKPLEPILVLPVGKGYYVIDGHHRVEAFHSVKWERPVPVEVFQGSLEEARVEAFLRNSKDKLPMSKEDKMEGAWTLVKEAKLTVEKMSDTTQTSQRQIYYMRSQWKKLCALPKERLPDDKKPADLSWPQARRVVNNEAVDFDEKEWVDKKVQKLVDALHRTKMGQALTRNAEVTAEALARLHDGLPRALVWEWFNATELQEMIDELGEPEF
jgi:ParB-like chromosome segregation protein Spo0J